MTKMCFFAFVGFVSFGFLNGLSAQTPVTDSMDWQFSLPVAESIVKTRGLAKPVFEDKGCPENDWQFSLPPAPGMPMDYADAYRAVTESADNKKHCLLTVGATKEQVRIAKNLAKEKGYLFSAVVAVDIVNVVPDGLYVLSRTSAGKGVLVAYPTESRPVPVVPAVAPTRVECNNGKCVVIGP